MSLIQAVLDLAALEATCLASVTYRTGIQCPRLPRLIQSRVQIASLEVLESPEREIIASNVCQRQIKVGVAVLDRQEVEIGAGGHMVPAIASL